MEARAVADADGAPCGSRQSGNRGGGRVPSDPGRRRRGPARAFAIARRGPRRDRARAATRARARGCTASFRVRRLRAERCCGSHRRLEGVREGGHGGSRSTQRGEARNRAIAVRREGGRASRREGRVRLPDASGGRRGDARAERRGRRRRRGGAPGRAGGVAVRDLRRSRRAPARICAGLQACLRRRCRARTRAEWARSPPSRVSVGSRGGSSSSQFMSLFLRSSRSGVLRSSASCMQA